MRYTSAPAISKRRGTLTPQGILLIHGLVLLCFTGFLLAVFFGSTIPDVVYISAVGFAIVVGWMIVSWRLASGSFFNPYSLFIIAAAVFNGGDAFLELLHLNDNGILRGKFDDASIVRTVLFCAVSLACVHTGALIAAFKASRGGRRQIVEKATFQTHMALGFALLGIALVPAILLFRTNISDVVAEGYMSLFQRDAETGIAAWKFILMQFLLPAAFILLAGSTRLRSVRLLSVLIILLFAVLDYFLGYRSPATAALASFAWIWHTRVKKLPVIPTLAIAGVVVFILFPTIRVYRTTVGDERLRLSTFTQILESYDNPAIASVEEMGDTMKTVAYTMQLVPSAKEYEHGASYGFALLGLLPNVFGTPVHPSVAHGTPSAWLIKTVEPGTANAGGGWGYSFIAEAYLNFGWIGPCLVLLPLGWMIGTLQFWSERVNTPAAVGFAATVLFFMLLYVRAETSNVLRGVVWYGILPYVSVKLIAARGRKLRAPRLRHFEGNQAVLEQAGRV